MKDNNITTLDQALSRINGLYQKWYRARELNSYLLQTLKVLVTEPNLSQREISDNYQIPRQTVNNAIQALKKDGYIELQQDKRDKRWKKIIFTEQGRTFAQNAVSPLLELDQKIAEHMGKERYDLLIALLKEYGDALEQETQNR